MDLHTICCAEAVVRASHSAAAALPAFVGASAFGAACGSEQGYLI